MVQPHWLDRYGNKEFYQWRTMEQGGRTIYHRPLGLVESAFDSDGRYYEGRADMNIQVEVEFRSSLSHECFRERILFAWMCLRCQHLLLQAKAVSGHALLGRNLPPETDILFAINAPRSVIQAIEDAGKHLVFLEDHFDHVDFDDFKLHSQNVARVFDPDETLCKLFVDRPTSSFAGRQTLTLLLVCSHAISDGRTMNIWARSLIRLLNMPTEDLRKLAIACLQPAYIKTRLPPPQEALYPMINGNPARQRWFWVLTRILRHVRKPLPAGFINPLRRRTTRPHAVIPASIYSPILDYSSPTVLNTFPSQARITKRGTKRLHRLCREAKVSIGAGCFALVALLMMQMYERREPDVCLADRRPFITGFPLDPRAFFNHNVEPDSLMLAFSDGIQLNFLPSDLDLDGRFRLLAKQAHRQLAVYQKRKVESADKAGLLYMGSNGAGRTLQLLYLASFERWAAKLPDHARADINPQGLYPMRPNRSLQTCGVSSVGRRDTVLKPNVYDLLNEEQMFSADFRSIAASVRPRDDEFLVGVAGDVNGIGMNASLDGNAMDPVLVGEWCKQFETILDQEETSSDSML